MTLAQPLYTVAYLDVDAPAEAFLEGFRREHDPQVDVVAPHFTLVFGCNTLPEAVYSDHVGAIARATTAIRFHCRYAMLGADDLNDWAYVFLVPDEGNSEISLLHDRLYTGVLAQHLRLEFPYIPHITIGATQNRKSAKSLCDSLNHAGVDLEGQLRSLTVGVLRDGKVHPLAEHRLAPAKAA